MNEVKKHWTKWLYWFLFAVAVITVYKTLDNFSSISSWIGNFFSIVAPFLVGVLIAYLLYIPTKKMENAYEGCKVKFISKHYRKLSVFTVYLIAIIIIIILTNVILPVVFDSVIELTNNFQGSFKTAIQNYQDLPEDSIFKGEFVEELVKNKSTSNLTELAVLGGGLYLYNKRKNNQKKERNINAK